MPQSACCYRSCTVNKKAANTPAGAAIVWQSLSATWAAARVDYSTFLKEVQAANVRRVRIDGLSIQGEWVKIPPARPLADGVTMQEFRKEFTTSIPMIESRVLLETLLEGKTEVATSQSSPSGWIDLVGTMIMIGVSVFILFFIMRRSQDPFGGGGMFGNFTRSQAKRFAPSEIRTTFDDVAGYESRSAGHYDARTLDHHLVSLF